ncbi:MAG TPA: hypothetical protein VGO31_15605 [Microbacteriaceae bacterium]|nr:hypothetical protein [Microbacteriaceae bacterium]
MTTRDDSDMSGNVPSNPNTNPNAVSGDPVIAAMIHDSGGDSELGAVLEHLRALGNGQVPTPSPELAKLLAAGLPGGASSKGRMRPGHRALLGVILVGGLGTAAAGAAFAEEGIRRGAEDALAKVITLTPFGPPSAVPSETPAATPAPGADDHGGRGQDGSVGGDEQANLPTTESPTTGSDDGTGGSSGGSSDQRSATPSAPPESDTPRSPSDDGSVSSTGPGSSGSDQAKAPDTASKD